MRLCVVPRVYVQGQSQQHQQRYSSHSHAHCDLLALFVNSPLLSDYVDANGELIDDIVLPAGATTGREEGARSTGGGRRGSKSAAAAAAAEAGAFDFGMHPDYINQATFAALMQQGAWQVCVAVDVS